MKKRLKSRSAVRSVSNYYANHPEQNKFRGTISTIFYNVAALIICGVLLDITLNDTAGMITFFALAVLQIITCLILAVNYNSKMWLFSALVVFLIGCASLYM
ncbi:MAG: hypothetical protein ACTHMI_21290 [Mucilaginibacter sp.]